MEAKIAVAWASRHWIDLPSARPKNYERSFEYGVEFTHGSSWADKLAALEGIENKRQCSPG